MSDYIPKTDAEYNVWQFNLIALLSENATAWGISAEVITSLKASQTRWTTAYDKTSNKQNRTTADVITKNEAGEDFTKEIRDVVQQWLVRNPKVTDADRARLGITVRTNTHTPVPPPSTFPVGSVDFSLRLQHSISFYDQASAHSNAKPEGVSGCEIYLKVDGEAPKSVEEMNFQGTCTASPLVVKFESAKAGKTAWYWLRWVNRKGETGPWSTVVSAMIVG
ncbi:MAG: hypothetical protein PHR83_06955 [Paludibacter sp.]|nr:hypothetical protein [Paludibacter sp.]